MSEKIYCSCCGIAVEEDEYQIFEDRILCDTCLEERTTVCDHCGERIWRDEVEGDDYITLCVRCWDNHYTTCEECGRVIHYDNAHYDDDEDLPYCERCYAKLKSRCIHQYNYKPEPIFYGSGSLFMGVELEIDGGGENHENAQSLLDIANIGGHCRVYCKHDGSIHQGFEIVSNPMTLDYHLYDMNWQEIMEEALAMDYVSHNAGTCGLHIHVGRNAFGDSDEIQEAGIGRVVFFVEKHWNELVKFSRRSPSQLNRWAARYATISDTAKETYRKAKDKYAGRYVAVNLENYNTIEFRMFRGTLRYKTFAATLQLVEEICQLAICLSDGELEALSWSDFVSGIDREEKPELIEYLKTKRLYVNENLTESEEM
jgi:hypothetical protein